MRGGPNGMRRGPAKLGGVLMPLRAAKEVKRSWGET